jgi:endonuclease YncB( thermonuclease family)
VLEIIFVGGFIVVFFFLAVFRKPRGQNSVYSPNEEAPGEIKSPRRGAHEKPPTTTKLVPESTKEQEPEFETTLTGKCYVVDGDTIQIGKVRLRLAGIDAPELEHPWGKKAKWELVKLCRGHAITAEIEPDMSYGRVVATCYLPDGRDLSAEMVKMGLALDWPKFSGGKYSDFEPEGARKKHWKAAARQRGHMSVFNK